MKRLCLTALLSTVFLLSACQRHICVNPRSSLGTIDSRYEFQARKASSADPDWQNGNIDYRRIEVNQTLTLAELKGPGRITHLWFTADAQDPAYPRKLTLRIYWDDSNVPAVESPLGDFFGVGHGLLGNLDSEPVAISASGRAYNCYWPMPFRKSAKITVTNDSALSVPLFYWNIDWQKLKDLPVETPYFHAQYRQEFPCEADRNYLVLNTEGKGHYAGTVLSWQQRTNGWPGEGDDYFYIDGESVPSIRGTGTEDYIGDAWGFEAVNRPYYGVSVFEGWGKTGQRCTAYRWHIHDPISFDKSLKVAFEHKGGSPSGDSDFVERQDYYSSVAFWYQTGKAKRFATVPPGDERLPPTE